MTDGAQSDRDAIARQIDEFIRAYEAGDLDGVMDYYASDMIKLRQNAPPDNACP